MIKKYRKRLIHRMHIDRILPMIMVCLTLILCMGCSVNKEDTTVVLTTGFSENELFKIGQESCTKQEYMLYLTNMQNQYEQIYTDAIWDKKIGDSTVAEKIKNKALVRLTQIKTMKLLADSYGIQLSQEESDKVKKASTEYFNSLNDTEKEMIGVTENDIEKAYTEYEMACKVYELIIKDTNPEISDDEARTVSLSQILLKTYSLDEATGIKTDFTPEKKEEVRKLAEEIRNSISQGEDFDVLSARYNESSSMVISVNKGDLERQLQTEAFNLGKGEISNVIETKEGYVIVRCDSTLDRQQTDVNKEKILKQRKEEAFSQIYDDFVKEQISRLNQKEWEKITFIHDSKVTTTGFNDVFAKYFTPLSE